MRGRPMLALVGLIVTLMSGSAGTAGRAPAAPPAFAIVSPVSGDEQALVRVDPRTLKPLAGARVPLSRDLVPAGRSPDGRLAGFFDYRRPTLRVVDLEAMRVRGDVPLASGLRWRVRGAAWLTADRVAVVLQRMRGAYNQIVDRREVVLVDPLARRVVARRALPGSTAVQASASGGDKLVLMLGRGDRRGRTVRLAVVAGSGATRFAEIDLAAAAGRLRLPALVVAPTGQRAFLVSPGAGIVEVDLETMQVSAHAVSGGGTLFRPGQALLSRRQALWLDERTLAVTGNESERGGGVEISRPAGLALVDTTTWRARLLDRDVSGISSSGITLLAYRFGLERITVRGRPAQKTVGIGLRAYGFDGTRRWARFARQPLSATAFRDIALVHRYASAPVGWGSRFVVELGSGRQVGPVADLRQNIWLLPDAPAAPAPRGPAASTSAGEPAIELDGDGELLTGSAREDVTRVVAVLVDGSEHELTLDSDRFAYDAESAERSARVLHAFAGEQLVASVTLTVRCGGAAGPCAASVASAPEPTYAIIGGLPAGGTTLARVDPRTLRPVGRSLTLRQPYVYPYARSPDGTRLALTTYSSSLIRIVDLKQMKVVRELRLPQAGEARALNWVANDRLIVIAQRMSAPTRRYVRKRTATTLDPATGEVVASRPLTNKLAVSGIRAGGGRVVVLLRSSLGKGSTVELAVIDSNGSVRSRSIDVGRRRGGALNRPSLAVAPSGRRAFLLVPPNGREAPPLLEVDLETLSVSPRKVQVEPDRELPPAAIGGGVWVEAADDRNLVAAGAVAANTSIDPGPFPAAGVFVIDTVTWTARLLDPRALYFKSFEGRVITYGPTNRPRGRVRGSGVSVYELTGRRLSHLYGNRIFSQVELAGNYGHVLLGPPRTKRLVFDAQAGRALGMLPALRHRVELLEPPLAPASRRPAAAAAPAASPRQKADPFTRASNRGTRVQPKANGPGEREHTPRDLFLLRRDQGRAVYRIGGLRAGYTSCYATGPASEVGRLGLTACGRARLPGFPSHAQPVLNLSGIQLRRGQKTPSLFRLEGLAADAVAEIGLLDADGEVVERVPVEANVYVLAAPPEEANGDLVAYDREGRIVFRSGRGGERNPPPPSTETRTLAGFRIKLSLPKGWSGEIRRSEAGPFRALVIASNRLPTRNARSVNVALSERDPHEKPAYPTLTRPPRLHPGDVRPTRGGRGRAERRFTLNGRQFKLQLLLGAARPPTSSLAAVNRLLASLQVGAIAVPLAIDASEPPLQRGRAEGVSVEVYRSGTVVFRFDSNSRLYRQFDAKQVSLACVTFDSVSPWEPNEAWTSRPLAPTVQVRISEATRPQQPYATIDPATEARAPFDGCLVSGSHGRRWNDPRGPRSPAEIALTPTGARFFAERAVARDLALFVRSPGMSAIRRAMKRGAPAPSAAAIADRFPARVVALAGHDTWAPAGVIGVRTTGKELIEVSERTPGGQRLFIRLRGGRIGQHNLHGLAFVF